MIKPLTKTERFSGLCAGLLIIACVPAKSQDSITNGLMGYYPFNGNADDASGNGRHGTIQGAVSTQDRRGISGKAMSFNGSGQFVSLPAASILNGAAKASISLWLRDSSTLQTGAILGTWNESNGGIYLNDYVGSSFAIALLPNGQISRASATMVGDWHHVVVTFDGTQTGNAQRLKCYVDGSGVALSIPYSLPDSLGGGAPAILIGARHVTGTPGDFFSGQIDDVRIYNRALSPTDVAQLYAAETGPILKLERAVRPSFSNLTVGTVYQLQTSEDLNTWTERGSTFTATTATMVYPEYFDVVNWGKLYFRLTAMP